MPEEANHFRLDELPVKEAADVTGEVPGGAGSGGGLDTVDRADRTPSRQQGPAQAHANAASEHAANLPNAVVVFDVGSGDGRCALLNWGTMVDAIIIHAAPSTRNRGKARDPEMYQTRKGNQWFRR